MQLVIIFTFQVPFAYAGWRTGDQSMLKMFGIMDLDGSPNFEWYVRINLVLASFAVTLTTMYKKATLVLEKLPQRTIVQLGSKSMVAGLKPRER